MWNSPKLPRPVSAQPLHSHLQITSEVRILELKTHHMRQTTPVLIHTTLTHHRRTRSRSVAVILIRSHRIRSRHLPCSLPTTEATVCLWAQIIPYLATAGLGVKAGCVGPGAETASFHQWEHLLVPGSIQLGLVHSPVVVVVVEAGARHTFLAAATCLAPTTTNLCPP